MNAIRPATPNDVARINNLMREFAEFERLPFETDERRLREALFGDGRVAEALVAEESGGIAGYAIFYPMFATFRGQRGLFLEDLYVSPGARGAGLGRRFLEELARIASSRGYERIDFQVLEWNTPAIGFYESLGAVRYDEDRHFKFAGVAFAALAASGNPGSAAD